MSRIPTLIFSTFVLSLLGTTRGRMEWSNAPTPCCGTASFAGTYIGGAIGYARQRAEILNETPGAPAEGLTFKDSDSVTFGGHVGNFQRCCSPFVFGIGRTSTTSTLHLRVSILNPDPRCRYGGKETTSLESSINWFGTLRGRAGFVVHDNLLLYATGGLAYASVDHTLSDDCVGCGTPPAPGVNLGTFSQSNDKTKVGWTVGGGAEFLHFVHWVLRAEALYVDLGSETRPAWTAGNGR